MDTIYKITKLNNGREIRKAIEEKKEIYYIRVEKITGALPKYAELDDMCLPEKAIIASLVRGKWAWVRPKDFGVEMAIRNQVTDQKALKILTRKGLYLTVKAIKSPLAHVLYILNEMDGDHTGLASDLVNAFSPKIEIAAKVYRPAGGLKKK